VRARLLSAPSDVRNNPAATVRKADGARRSEDAGTTDSPETVSYMSSLPEAECFELLAGAIVGRMGFVSPAGLQIIPMNFRLGADHQLFIKTATGSAVAQLAEIDAPVAFEVQMTSGLPGAC
jgi:Pyridoxamine 5'-phosphate oxidase